MTPEEGLRLATKIVRDFANAGLRPPFLQSIETETEILYFDVYDMQTGEQLAHVESEQSYDRLMAEGRQIARAAGD